MYLIKVQNKDGENKVSINADSNRSLINVIDFIDKHDEIELISVERCLMYSGIEGIKDAFGIK
jgi:hypothetical protein